ncbi:hypothetical protein Ciccas_013934 [Cichlidogyrus casuarinus]|uniref:Uncharacterized protein n=1 Tax=Cichlidogyrus casuarinus TaxID=1844966 RepID=A0ABD2PJW0_9PLAT
MSNILGIDFLRLPEWIIDLDSNDNVINDIVPAVCSKISDSVILIKDDSDEIGNSGKAPQTVIPEPTSVFYDVTRNSSNQTIA